MSESSAGETVVLIHGLWMTPRSWENGSSASRAGTQALAPSWPGWRRRSRRSARTRRRSSASASGRSPTTTSGIIRGLDRPPIIIGHSFGGLITQLLLDRGLGGAGVAIGDGAGEGRPRRCRRRRCGPGGRRCATRSSVNGLTPLSLEQFRYRFTNILTRSSREVYDRYYIPGPRGRCSRPPTRIQPEGGHEGQRRQARPRAAAADRRRQGPHLPARHHEGQRKIYAKSHSTTDLRQYPGKTHWIAGQPGWEEVADYALGLGDARHAAPKAVA